MAKYPCKLTVDEKPFLSLRSDEVFVKEGTITGFDIGDALERFFWELSNNSLIRIKEDIMSNSKSKGALNLVAQSISKILSQRKFIQDNEAFRNALIPE